MGRRRLTLAALVVLVGGCTAPARSDASLESRPDTSIVREVIDRTNAARNRGRRAPLRGNPRLMRAAQIHAEQMARTRRLAHVLPGADYPRIEDRLAAARYEWQTFGENVALGQSSGAHAVESWMRSRGHRENILNPGFSEIGVGYARDDAGQPYYVQVLAGPLS